jgi:hypothetical protein
MMIYYLIEKEFIGKFFALVKRNNNFSKLGTKAMLATHTIRSSSVKRVASFSSLPLLDFLINQADYELLDDVCIIGGQHLLQTTHLMLQALYELNLKPANVFLIGKCYSTSSSVYSQMIEDGINIDQSSLSFKSHQPFDQFYKISVKKFYNQIKKTVNKIRPKKIIVLDDGGELLSHVNPNDFDCKQIIGIEQTSSGYNKLVNQPLKFPIINVARSWAKLRYESPIISEFALKKFFLSLPERTWEKALIVGGGPIGLAIKDKLKQESQVDIFDTVSERSNISSLRKNLSSYDLIIGCTGSISISHTLHSLLKEGCILASVSSSDREFDAHYLRKKTAPYENCHCNLSVEGKLLLNSGFPINFDGGIHSVEPKYIQLTRALLVAAIFQSTPLCSEPPQILELSPNYQRQIINFFINKILSGEEKAMFYPNLHKTLYTHA